MHILNQNMIYSSIHLRGKKNAAIIQSIAPAAVPNEWMFLPEHKLACVDTTGHHHQPLLLFSVLVNAVDIRAAFKNWDKQDKELAE